jgi:hypothetical protein
VRWIGVVVVVCLGCAHEIPRHPSRIAPIETREAYFERYRHHGLLNADPRSIRPAVDDDSPAAEALDAAAAPYVAAQWLYVGGGASIAAGVFGTVTITSVVTTAQADESALVYIAAPLGALVGGSGLIALGMMFDAFAQDHQTRAAKTFEHDLRATLDLPPPTTMIARQLPVVERERFVMRVVARVDGAVIAEADLRSDGMPKARFVDDLHRDRAAQIGELLAIGGEALVECGEANVLAHIERGVVVRVEAIRDDSQCAADAIARLTLRDDDTYDVELDFTWRPQVVAPQSTYPSTG